MKSERRQLDMLHGTIWDKIPKFALPLAATAILGQFFNAADLAVVGHFTGDDSTAAVAAVGANSVVIGLLVNLFIGIALGANVVIANAIGRSDCEAVGKAVHTSIVVAFWGGILVGAVGECASGILLEALRVPEEVFPMALSYLRIYLLGMPAILLYNFEAAIFRSVGDTRTPLVALGMSGILNIILNLLFVVGLGMSVDGVALATVVANAVSAVLLFRRLCRADCWIGVEWGRLRIDLDILWKILRIGLPAGLQSAVFSISNIVIQSSINSLGKDVMAASSAAYNIEIFAYDVLNAFSQACTTFVGQNFGAGKIGRCRRTLALCLVEDAVASAVAIGIVLFMGKWLLAAFTKDPAVVDIGYTRLEIIFFAYIFTMQYEVISGYLRGFGISIVPAVLTTVGVCGVRIVWIMLAFEVNRTFETIMAAYPISLATTALLMIGALCWYRPSRRFAAMEAE